jgi:outer membrane cobalamin receptor
LVRYRNLFVALVVCASLAAQEPRVEMVVTVERDSIPRDEAAAAVTLFDRKEIEQLPATSLSELLAYVPGVMMMFDSGASGAPMITSRGFFGGGEVEYVKLLVDGVPVGDPESGLVDWRRFRTADIERLEVLHGPGSALYGDAALGGVVQLFTRQEERGELSLRGGSYDGREVDAGYVTNLGVYRLALRAGSADSGGFRDHAEVSDRSLEASLLRTNDHSRWRVDLSGSRKDRREPGPLTSFEIEEDRAQSNALFRFDRDETERRRISATYEAFGTTELLATVHATNRDGDNLRTYLLAPGYGTTATRALETRTYGTTFEAAREVFGGTVRAGLDVDRSTLNGRYASIGDDGETLGVVAAQDGRRDRLGLFVTGAWNVCGRCRLSAGIRRDELRDDFSSVEHDDSAWSPRAGLTVRVGGASVFVQVSRAFKAATLDQLFDPRPYPDGSGGTFTVSNPTLRPQRARNVEAGVTGSRATADWSLVAYRMNVTDEIDFDPQTFSYNNIGNSIHRGVEASAAFAKTFWLSPRVTYAWTRVADRDSPEQQLKNIPEHVAQLLLHARLPKATSVDLAYRWTHGMSLDDEGAFVMPDVSRVDLRVARDFARVRLSVDVLNALDAEYNELGYVLFDFTGQPAALEFPAPGRVIRAGATLKF